MDRFKIGIIIVDEQISFAHRNLSAAVESLKALGCVEQDIAVRHAPKLFGVTAVTQFFAEYTDVDAVAVLAENDSTVTSGDGSFSIPDNKHPYVIMVVGVNGVGKTTTIGKLAYQYRQAGYSVMLGAADTFRAAAVEQIDEWGRRAGVPVVKQQLGSDAAAVAYDTLSSAVAQNIDVVIIDTAGRLHNKKGLMDELTKIKRVMDRVVPGAPHEVLLVLDGSTGQNAFEQARQFSAATQVTALAVTKLDGTARGGVVIGISDQLHIPVKYIGLGEGIGDLQVFDKREFVESLFGRR